LLYLPKTWPSEPPYVGNIMDETSLVGYLKTAQMTPIWSPNACRVSIANKAPSVQLSLPECVTVSSGSHIPLKLTIACPQSPALTELLRHNVEVKFMRRIRAWVKGSRLVSNREIAVSDGILVETKTSQEGVAILRYDLMAGQSEREQSWSVEGAIEVAHFIRVSIRPDSSTSAFLPTYQYDERIQVSTDPWGTRDSELLQLGGTTAPALGLSNVGQGNSSRNAERSSSRYECLAMHALNRP